MKKTLLIIPAYNEEGSLLSTVTAVEEFKEKVAFQLDYVIINDGSTDGTKAVIEDNNLN